MDKSQNTAQSQAHLPKVADIFERESLFGIADFCRHLCGGFFDGFVEDEQEFGEALLQVIERRDEHLVGIEPIGIDVVLLQLEEYAVEDLERGNVVIRRIFARLRHEFGAIPLEGVVPIAIDDRHAQPANRQ